MWGNENYIEKFQGTLLDTRKNHSERILRDYPGMIPVIVGTDTQILQEIKKNKFLVPEELTVGRLITEIRKNLNPIHSTQTIFLFIDNTLPAVSETIRNIYSKHKHEDGFLYVVYSGENTFG